MAFDTDRLVPTEDGLLFLSILLVSCYFYEPGMLLGQLLSNGLNTFTSRKFAGARTKKPFALISNGVPSSVIVFLLARIFSPKDGGQDSFYTT